MIISSEKTLDLFRTWGRCSWCGKQGQREAAHVFACGRSNANRLDIRINLIALGLGPWAGLYTCTCHVEHHAGRDPTQRDLLAVVAAREGELQDDIERAVRIIQNLDKAARPWQLDAALKGSNEAVKRLVNDALKGRVTAG